MMRGRYASRSTFLLSRVTEPLVTDFVPCVRPSGHTPSRRAVVKRHVEFDGRALWSVGDREASVELTEKTLDDLEAKACPRLVNIEILREADSLIGDLDT